ncbi:MAG TPA: YrhB domain-containing protein [Longimicrobium sp.]|nr:YrhB domain-containing protein [Longimicrobium sp.]
MITREEAVESVSRRVNENYRVPGDELVVLADRIIEKPYGWIVFYTSRRWHETDDPRHAIAGNAPFLVLRDTGEMLPIPLGRPVDDSIREFEERGPEAFRTPLRARLLEAWRAWNRVPPPTERWAAGNRRHPAAGIECEISHVATSVHAFYRDYMGGGPWDFATLAANRLAAVGRAEAYLAAAEGITPGDRARYQAYLAQARDLIERVRDVAATGPWLADRRDKRG